MFLALAEQFKQIASYMVSQVQLTTVWAATPLGQMVQAIVVLVAAHSTQGVILRPGQGAVLSTLMEHTLRKLAIQQSTRMAQRLTVLAIRLLALTERFATELEVRLFVTKEKTR